MNRFLVISFLFGMSACGSGGSKSEKSETSETSDITQNPDYQKGLALVSKYQCFTCHKIDESHTGPSYRNVANRYAGASNAKVDELAQKIISGGKGNWGEIMMTPHPSITEDEAKAMVRYVLLLKK